MRAPQAPHRHGGVQLKEYTVSVVLYKTLNCYAAVSNPQIFPQAGFSRSPTIAVVDDRSVRHFTTIDSYAEWAVHTSSVQAAHSRQ